MQLTRRLIVLGAIVCSILPLVAQGPDPSVLTNLAKFSNLTFGWVSMSGVDPTLPMLTSFAPPMIALRDAGYHTGGEGVMGVLSFGDLDVKSNFQSAMTACGPGIVRISHYAYDSNTAGLSSLQGALPGSVVDTDGDAIELSYAQHIGRGTLGVSLVPKDSSSAQLTLGGMSMVDAKTETDWGGRVGFIAPVAKQLHLGADFSYQRDAQTGQINTMLMGAPAPAYVPANGSYATRCTSIGMSWQARPSTLAYGSYQFIRATGTTMTPRDAELIWFGVQQDISKRAALRVNYLDGGLNLSMQLRTAIGIANLAYTHKALMNARDILGEGDAAFIALAFGF